MVPVYRTLFSDRVSPVTAFELVGRDEHAFLLESARIDDQVGRYSFVSTRPRAVYQSRGKRAVLWRQGQPLEENPAASAFEDVSRMLGSRRCAMLENLPEFAGGLVGYFSYDLLRSKHGEVTDWLATDDRGLPEASFGLYDDVIVFDHIAQTMSVVANVHVDHSRGVTTDTLKSAYDSACWRIDLLVQRLNQPSMLSISDIDLSLEGGILPAANFTSSQFEARVQKVRDAFRLGAIEGFSPSVRLRLQSDVSPLDVYRALRVIKPSPFMYLLKSPQCSLIGSSSRECCGVDGRVVDVTIPASRPTGSDAIGLKVPAQCVAGAPVEAAMRLIDELEPTRRGPFAGAVARFGFGGAGQACVARRLLIWRNGSYDAQASVDVSGDWTPQACYDACLNESRALMRAVEIAPRG